MKRILLFLCALILCSFGGPLKKIITDTSYRYEFYTTQEKPKPLGNRMYFWFKGGAIHSSESGIAGELLDGAFVKYYLDNQLAETGRFYRGLRIGTWKSWHPNGKLSTEQSWSNGRMNGKFYSYSSSGTLMEKGSYSAGKKDGVWINGLSKDTVEYKKGEVFKRKPSRSMFRKRTPEEKKLDSISKVEEKKARELKREKREAEKNSAEKPKKGIKNQGKPTKKAADSGTDKKKGNFFSRLFSKKDKKNDGQGQ